MNKGDLLTFWLCFRLPRILEPGCWREIFGLLMQRTRLIALAFRCYTSRKKMQQAQLSLLRVYSWKLNRYTITFGHCVWFEGSSNTLLWPSNSCDRRRVGFYACTWSFSLPMVHHHQYVFQGSQNLNFEVCTQRAAQDIGKLSPVRWPGQVRSNTGNNAPNGAQPCHDLLASHLVGL